MLIVTAYSCPEVILAVLIRHFKISDIILIHLTIPQECRRHPYSTPKFAKWLKFFLFYLKSVNISQILLKIPKHRNFLNLPTNYPKSAKNDQILLRNVKIPEIFILPKSTQKKSVKIQILFKNLKIPDFACSGGVPSHCLMSPCDSCVLLLYYLFLRYLSTSSLLIFEVVGSRIYYNLCCREFWLKMGKTLV